MLLSFRFANHRSFRDENQLNLTPVYAPPADRVGGKVAVPVVGIFGGNASGKSNCLHALSFMRQAVLHSDRDVEPGISSVARDPFRLDTESTDEPSRYIVDLSLENVHYSYGLTVNAERVLEEWLTYDPLKRARRVFDRRGDTFTWGEESGKRPDLERIAGITAPTALFLSTVARFGKPPDDPQEPEPLHKTYRWFYRQRVRLQQPNPTHRMIRLYNRWPRLEEERQVVVDLLKAADIGIVDVQMKQGTPVQGVLAPELAETLEGQRTVSRRVRELAAPPPRLQFTHRGAAGSFVFDLDDESLGTRQLLDLSVDASYILRGPGGGVLLVDEIDASLHPLLSARLIGLFQSPKTNPWGSQLVFTSHDAALLGTFDTEEVLQRDEIWFTEKDDFGVSALYPLSDFKPRRDGENRTRRYINGNYGGVPDLSSYLFERALASRGETSDESAG